MSSFIVLGNWTDQGIRAIQDAPERIKTTHDMIKKAGGKMQLYFTMGEYDFVIVVDGVKDEDMVAILLCLGSMGNIRTKTLKAWAEEEGTKLLTAPHPKFP
ncbi:MAG TPA: GYD domain-containing protein [Candidatus Limnocylindrales bacterium]|nr:GYD domain-containing protein [Candidatus Limnocylindrales bacterium]